MNSLSIHPQGCSQDAHRQNWAENSTQWDLLAFEIVKEWQWDCGEQWWQWEQWGKRQWERKQTQDVKQSQEISEDHFDVFSLDS